MLDKKLNDTSSNTLCRIGLISIITLGQDILPSRKLGYKTYEYSQTVDDTRYTGESCPPATISYSRVNYSGT